MTNEHIRGLTSPSSSSRSYSPTLQTGSGVGWAWRQRLSRSADASVAPETITFLSRSPKLARVEAALFVADAPLSARKLAQIATLQDGKEAIALVEQLNALLDADRSTFRVERVAAGYRLLTRPELATWLDRVHHRQEHLKLSPPMLETLAIIAYRQPCTRADVEAIRGVQSAELIKQLMERNLVRVVGADDSLGRPYLYGTTRVFLETYGLTNLDQLPMADVLKRQPADSEPADETETADQSAA